MNKPLLKYIAVRSTVLFLVIVIAIYITILVANMGGYVDRIVIGEIQFNVANAIKNDPQYKNYPPDQIKKLIEERVQVEIKRLGLDKPFIFRSFRYLWNGITLDLGRAQYLTSDTGSKLVRNIILERLPPTIMLFTTAIIINFVVHLFVGLYLSRKYGSLIDKIIVSLAPTSVIPGWFYGIFLILIFAFWFRILPYGGFVDSPPPQDPFLYALSVLKHMILPILSWFIASLFIGIYSNRNFFLIFSTEDYVEAAKARGIPPRTIEWRYILRPSLPPIITSFALAIIASWGGAIITETVFGWPGLGLKTYEAIVAFDVPVLVGVTVIYAYLLAATVLILDIIYGLIDPRIKVGFS